MRGRIVGGEGKTAEKGISKTELVSQFEFVGTRRWATRLNSAPSLAQSRGRGVSMATLATGKPVLNIGKISDTRFKFSFATDEGTLFCEISIPMKAGDTVPDDLRRRVAVAKLKRLLEAMGETLNDLD